MSRIYDSVAWKRLRAKFLRAHPLCEPCERDGVLRAAAHVDHRVAITAGGEAFDWANLESMCVSCHSRKTRIMDVQGKDRVPAKGCDASGRPLDQQHWWNK